MGLDSGMVVVIIIAMMYMVLVFGLLFYVKNEWCDLLLKNFTVSDVYCVGNEKFIFFSLEKLLPGRYCLLSRMLLLKTKMGFKHHQEPPPPRTNILKGSTPIRRPYLTFRLIKG